MELKKYSASRLSKGNLIFPLVINIEEEEITIKFPGLFSGKSRHLVFQQIQAVHVDSPFIGYSTITIVVGGEKIVSHGFTKNTANTIKQICSGKISANSPRSQTEIIANAISNAAGITKNNTQVNIADEIIKLKNLLEMGIITEQEFTDQKNKLLNK